MLLIQSAAANARPPMPLSESVAGYASISTSLLLRVRTNEPEAWERLCRLFGPVLYDWVRRGGVPERDAVDVVQDVYVDLSRSIGKFKCDEAGHSFGGWLRSIAKRRCIDWLRRQAKVPNALGGSEAHRNWLETPGDADAPDEDAETTSDIVRSGLDLIRDEFEGRTWQAFEATTLGERPPADVARHLGMTVGAVYVAKSRVLKRLRRELEGILDGLSQPPAVRSAREFCARLHPASSR